jgi:uncharacterized protein
VSLLRLLFIGFSFGSSCTSRQAAPPANHVPDTVVTPQAKAPRDVSDQDYVMPALPKARVTVTDVFRQRHVVDVEVAATTPSRTRGLMWRTALAETAGMLFIFPVEQPLRFWMRNTLIPLDMLFIRKNGTVLGVVENAEPQTETGREVEGASTYVLEVPGGWCKKRNIRAGAQVTFEGLDYIAAE